MDRLLAALIAALIGLLAGLHGPAAVAQDQSEAVRLRRGINVTYLMAYPQSLEWPIFRGPRAAISDDELRRLAAAGFDFVRLPVEPQPLLDRSPGEIATIEQRLVTMVRRITAAGLRVMVTGWARHETTPGWRASQIVASRDSPELRTYIGLLKRIIALLRDIPDDRWVLEPMNEPQVACQRTDGPDWTTIQRDIYREIRSVAPTLTVVITPGCWSSLRALRHLDMGGYDARTLLDFHYYEPHPFTHQGTTWGAEPLKALSGLSFPPELTDREAAAAASARLFEARGTKGGAAAFTATLREIDDYVKTARGPDHIARGMAEVRVWAEQQRIDPARIILGEFGAYRIPDPAKFPDDCSRLRWLETVRRAAEAQGFGWALYSYHGSFGIVADDGAATWDTRMVQALGLEVRGK